MIPGGKLVVNYIIVVNHSVFLLHFVLFVVGVTDDDNLII